MTPLHVPPILSIVAVLAILYWFGEAVPSFARATLGLIVLYVLVTNRGPERAASLIDTFNSGLRSLFPGPSAAGGGGGRPLAR